MKRKPEQTSDKLKQQQYQNELLKKYVVGTLAPIARDGMVRTLKTGGDKNKGKMGAYISGVIYMNSKDAGIPDQSAYQAAMTAADNLVPAVKAVRAQVNNMKTRNPFIKFDELLNNVTDFITSSAIHGPGSDQMNQEQKDYIKKKSKGDIIVKTLEPFVQKQQLKGGAEPLNDDENEINLSWLSDDDDFIGKLKGGISFWESPWNWVKEKFGYETDQQKAERERLEEERARQLDAEEYSRRDHAYDSQGIDRSERDYNLHRLMQKRAMEANQPGVLKKTWNAIKEAYKAHPVGMTIGTVAGIAGIVALPYLIPKVAGYLAPAAVGVGAQKLTGNNGVKTEEDINLTPDEAEGVRRTVTGVFNREKMGTSSYPSSFAERLYKPKVEQTYKPNLEEQVKKAQEELANQKFMNVAQQSSFGDILSQYGKNLSPEDRKHVLNIVNSERQMWGTRNPTELFQYKRDITANLRNIQQALQKQGIDISEQLSDAKADFNTIFNTHLTAPLPKTWGDTAKEWSGVWMPMATKLGSKVMTSMGMKDDEAQQLASQIGDFTQSKINQGIQLKQQQRAMTIQNLQQREFLRDKQHFHKEMMEREQKLHNEQQQAYKDVEKEEREHKNKFDQETLKAWAEEEKKARDADDEAEKKTIEESQKLLKTFFDKHKDAKKAFEAKFKVEIPEEYYSAVGLAGVAHPINKFLTKINTFFNGDNIGAVAKQEYENELRLKLLELKKKYPPVNMELVKRKFDLEHQYIPLHNLDLYKEKQEQEMQRLKTQIKHEEGMLDTLQQQEAKQVAIPITTPVHMPTSSAKISVTPVSIPDLNVAKEIEQNQQAVSIAAESQPTEANMPTYVNAGPNRKTIVKPITVTPMIPQTYTPVNREQQLSQILSKQSATVLQSLPHSMKLEMMPLEQKGKIAATAVSAATAAAATAALGGTPVQIALSAMKPVADAVDSKPMKTAISSVEKFRKEKRKEEKEERKEQREIEKEKRKEAREERRYREKEERRRLQRERRGVQRERRGRRNI